MFHSVVEQNGKKLLYSVFIALVNNVFLNIRIIKVLVFLEHQSFKHKAYFGNGIAYVKFNHVHCGLVCICLGNVEQVGNKFGHSYSFRFYIFKPLQLIFYKVIGI